jgi:hypothetical protein
MKTVGNLRRELALSTASWKVNPELKADDPVPEHPTGGKPPRVPTPARVVPWKELRLILGRPSPNPLITQRRIVRGYLDSPAIGVGAQLAGASADAGTGSGLPPSGPLLPVLDWRKRFGWSWITTVQDQMCADSWCFATSALVESMVRIEHCVWSKRSERDIRRGTGRGCQTAGNVCEGMQWVADRGLCDEACAPYTNDDVSADACADRDGRCVKISWENYVNLPSPAADSGNLNYQLQKTWLDLNGPLIAWLVADNLGGYGEGVFDAPSIELSDEIRGHFVLIVGYDDTLSPPAWICKNSWNVDFGMEGYFYLAYGAANSDRFGQFGLYGTNPDPWAKRRMHGGAMIESGEGVNHDALELVSVTGKFAGEPSGQLRHYQRRGDRSVWSTAGTFGSDASNFPALIESTFNRNLESVYVANVGRLHHWSFDRRLGEWCDQGAFGPSNAVGRPAFIQSDLGCPGNFEVVVPTSEGILQHWRRTHDANPYTWSLQETFGSNIRLSGVALVQSHWGVRGNFECIAVLSNGQMQHFYHDNDSGGDWGPASSFGTNISSTPCLIEGQYGADDENAVGNFELCVSTSLGQVEHWSCDNGGGVVWRLAATFGSNVAEVLALLEGSRGFSLEVIVLRRDGQLQHYYRDAEAWREGDIVGPA